MSECGAEANAGGMLVFFKVGYIVVGCSANSFSTKDGRPSGVIGHASMGPELQKSQTMNVTK